MDLRFTLSRQYIVYKRDNAIYLHERKKKIRFNAKRKIAFLSNEKKKETGEGREKEKRECKSISHNESGLTVVVISLLSLFIRHL